jgi:hypothetical protein
VNLFELLFLLLAFAALATVGTSAVYAVTGRGARALRLLRRLGIGAAVYFATVIVVSIVSPRLVYRVGDEQRFDDWCITVLSSRRSGGAENALEVSLRLTNRARGAAMGEEHTVAYVTDANGRRFDSQFDPAAVRFDTRLDPGQSSLATRRFLVPPDARGLGLVYTHEGGFPIGWFIIGEGGWFSQPPIVRLD